MNKNYSSIPETLEHIKNVSAAIRIIIDECELRGIQHDRSKLTSPELEYFDKYTPLLKTLKYGSDEYKQSLQELKPALDHHYKINRHHPEYHKNGINDMTLVDVIEMFCDWIAASKRTKNGDAGKGIDISCKRFHVSEQLRQIFQNTKRDVLKI